MKKYIVVTTTSTHICRFVIPNEAIDGDTEKAKELVSNSYVKEFSQQWLGEKIIDIKTLDEQEMLLTFDEENDYLSSWSREQKLKFLNEWKDVDFYKDV